MMGEFLLSSLWCQAVFLRLYASLISCSKTLGWSVADFIVLLIQDRSYSFLCLLFTTRKKKPHFLILHCLRVVTCHCPGQWSAGKSLLRIWGKVFVFLIQMLLLPSPFLFYYVLHLLPASRNLNVIVNDSAAILYPWSKN